VRGKKERSEGKKGEVRGTRKMGGKKGEWSGKKEKGRNKHTVKPSYNELLYNKNWDIQNQIVCYFIPFVLKIDLL